MKKNVTLIFLYFAVAVSNNSDAYFYTATNSIAPVAYYTEDSLPTRIGHVNPVLTLAAISSPLAPIVFIAGWKGNLGFDPGPLTATLFIFGIVGGIIGFVVRKKLMAGKYASYPEPKKLPLGQGRSLIGIFGSLLVTALIAATASCG
ncbi:hypothetical protein [Persicitalea sp.]|uniref:hypothetical protein n=1 Tax=Persicitalea sp. TaxID=3100273 RepID=UPI003593C123